MYHCIARSSRGNAGWGTAVAPLPRWIGNVSSERPPPSLTVGSRPAEGVELVAVGIAEIGRVKAAAAPARRAFVAAAVGERDGVKAVHLRRVLGLERNHRAVADRGGVAVERPGHRDARAAASDAPGDVRVAFHEA